MTPAHFLTLTARPEKLARVMAEVNARPGHAYGQGAPWCLGVDIETGKVLYHDGRHRAARALLNGDSTIPVSVRLHHRQHFATDGKTIGARFDEGMAFHACYWGNPVGGRCPPVLIAQRDDTIRVVIGEVG